MRKKFQSRYLLACVVAAVYGTAATAAQEHVGHEHDPVSADLASEDPHAHHRAMMSKPAPDQPALAADIVLKDLTLIDQDGKDVDFVTDVIADRVVVVDFVYTTCTTVCPVLSALFGQVQQRLGARLGEQVSLVSISVDPARDTPQRLKAYAERHKAKPGWVWLTGPKTSLNQVLEGLDAYTPNFEDHAAMVLVGDGRTGQWLRFLGFPSPDRIMDQVDALLAARSVSAGG